MPDEEFAYRTDRPVEELRKELEDLAAEVGVNCAYEDFEETRF